MPHLPKVVFAYPGASPNMEQAARALWEAGMLSTYVTTFAYQPDRFLGRFLRLVSGSVWHRTHHELSRRQITAIPEEYVSLHPWPEFLRIAAHRLNMGAIVEDWLWEKTMLWFDRLVARKYVPYNTAIYGFEFSSLDSFKMAKQQHKICILDKIAPHHKTLSSIIEREFELYPEVQTSYDMHVKPLAAQRNARTDAELHQADCIIAASTFTKQSLIQAGVRIDSIRVVPLGAPAICTQIASFHRKPFVFLCAGTQSVRKGVHYLLDAWRKLRPDRSIELWLIGRMMLPSHMLQNLPGSVVIRPSVPRHELYLMYRRASVLVFPSLCDGFGMVITEAMAHGLPVITTPNTAAPDLITNGEDGLIVPIRDADALAEAMQWCLDHPEDLATMGERALARAARQQWCDYRARLRDVMYELLGEPL